MKLATVRTATGTTAIRVEADRYVDLGWTDVGALLASAGWEDAATADGPTIEASAEGFAPVVLQPGKIVCVGINYRAHVREMGRQLPTHPTLFAKFADALIGARDPIRLPPESDQVDWEAELALVVGRAVRRASEEEAAAAIAGFTVLNDVTMRDWQYRSTQWLQGKTFEASTPVGPVLVTPDELVGGPRPRLLLSADVDGERVQETNTADAVFDPVDLIRYVSTITTLRPGDLISTGTPGGVGHARTPARYLSPGSVVETAIDGIGRLTNAVVAEADLRDQTRGVSGPVSR